MKPETEGTSPDDEAKVARLRALAKEAFDDLDRGEGILLNSDNEIAAFLRSLGEDS